MSDFSIQTENIGKKFSKDLTRSMVYGAQDILNSITGIIPDSSKLRAKEFWAVDDVSFEVKKGETLGLIGPNGSGKSTIFKMLNGIFMPDKGRIEINGKVGALIEVGAGFHPMLSGRENVYINATILGMSKREIDKKFDAIVDFADIGDFIDSPVKYYSSGMFVRLGFAVAIHCEPDILLVDEVLAVGDMNFQVKCHQKMLELKNTDRTVIFVSHNLNAISGLCDRTIFLNKGRLAFEGSTHEAIGLYKEHMFNASAQNDAFSMKKSRKGTGDVHIEQVLILDKKEKESRDFALGDPLTVRILFDAKQPVRDPMFVVDIFRIDGLHCSCINSKMSDFQVKEISGKFVVDLHYPRMSLVPNCYNLTVAVYDSKGFVPYDFIEKVDYFTVNAKANYNGSVCLEHQWRYDKR